MPFDLAAKLREYDGKRVDPFRAAARELTANASTLRRVVTLAHRRGEDVDVLVVACI